MDRVVAGPLAGVDRWESLRAVSRRHAPSRSAG